MVANLYLSGSPQEIVAGSNKLVEAKLPPFD